MTEIILVVMTLFGCPGVGITFGSCEDVVSVREFQSIEEAEDFIIQKSPHEAMFAVYRAEKLTVEHSAAVTIDRKTND